MERMSVQTMQDAQKTWRFEVNILTGIEQKVVDLIAKHKQNKEIGQILGISNNTVRAHCRKIFKKLNIKRRYDLWRFD
jgi:DNA-binding CsgD family transcriptional regulator